MGVDTQFVVWYGVKLDGEYGSYSLREEWESYADKSPWEWAVEDPDYRPVTLDYITEPYGGYTYGFGSVVFSHYGVGNIKPASELQEALAQNSFQIAHMKKTVRGALERHGLGRLECNTFMVGYMV